MARTRALSGAGVSGDGFVVRVADGGVHTSRHDERSAALDLATEHLTLVAAVDGLGHGAEAARAAHQVMAILESAVPRPRWDLEVLARRCHEVTLGLRGATLGLVSFEPEEIECLSIGNVLVQVASNVTRRVYSVFSSPGVVGYTMPPKLLTRRVALNPGDTVVMCTDGVAGGFTMERIAAWSALGETALLRAIDEGFGVESDDQTIIVARRRSDRSA